jgi:hypothetical protein
MAAVGESIGQIEFGALPTAAKGLLMSEAERLSIGGRFEAPAFGERRRPKPG